MWHISEVFFHASPCRCFRRMTRQRFWYYSTPHIKICRHNDYHKVGYWVNYLYICTDGLLDSQTVPCDDIEFDNHTPHYFILEFTAICNVVYIYVHTHCMHTFLVTHWGSWVWLSFDWKLMVNVISTQCWVETRLSMYTCIGYIVNR